MMEHKAMVFGDALSAFWEKEAQEHIANKWSHWVDRLINAVGTTRVGTLLKRGAPLGNSPENGHRADPFGFAFPPPKCSSPHLSSTQVLTPAPRTYTSARIIGFCAVWF